MREREIKQRAVAIGQACLANSVEGPRYNGFVQCYARKGAEMALREISHLLPEDPPLDPLEAAFEEICDDYGFALDGRHAQAVRVAVRRGNEIARGES